MKCEKVLRLTLAASLYGLLHQVGWLRQGGLLSQPLAVRSCGPGGSWTH
jgi:hypothetical protein